MEQPTLKHTVDDRQHPLQHGPEERDQAPMQCNEDTLIQTPTMNEEITMLSQTQSPNVNHGLSQSAEIFVRDISIIAQGTAEPPVATPSRRPRRACALMEGSTSIRRSRRIATTGLLGTALTRAQTVLMRKLGVISPESTLSQESRDAYAWMFEHPLSGTDRGARCVVWLAVLDNVEARSADLLLI